MELPDAEHYSLRYLELESLKSTFEGPSEWSGTENNVKNLSVAVFSLSLAVLFKLVFSEKYEFVNNYMEAIGYFLLHWLFLLEEPGMVIV